MLLALDTSGAASAAVGTPSNVLAAESDYDPRRHAEQLTPMMRSVLTTAGVTPHDLDGIVVGVGPGPFTGLRVALATATVCGHVWNLPVFGLCSLDAIAATAYAHTTAPDAELLVATDARRKEIYWATYTGPGIRSTGPAVNKAADLHLPNAMTAIGRGADLYRTELTALGHQVATETVTTDATAAGLLLAYGTYPEQPLVPQYLRKPDAQEPAKRPQVTP